MSLDQQPPQHLVELYAMLYGDLLVDCVFLHLRSQFSYSAIKALTIHVGHAESLIHEPFKCTKL